MHKILSRIEATLSAFGSIAHHPSTHIAGGFLMPYRTIATMHSQKPGLLARIQRNAEWGEFRVAIYRNHEHASPLDYYTDDRKDAETTARKILHFLEIA